MKMEAGIFLLSPPDVLISVFAIMYSCVKKFSFGLSGRAIAKFHIAS